MKDLNKYRGIFPAFYACYDDAGAVSPERTRALTEYLIGKGVTGLYVGGSSGECIYQSVAERKLLLEHVMAVARGRAPENRRRLSRRAMYLSQRVRPSNSGVECGRMSRPTTIFFAPVKTTNARPIFSARSASICSG